MAKVVKGICTGRLPRRFCWRLRFSHRTLKGRCAQCNAQAGPGRVSSPFHSAQPHSNGFGVTSPGRFVRRSAFVGPVGFRHNLRFHIFFGNACFSDPFFDPFFCRQFFFRNRFFFAQPAFFPYSVYASLPYDQVAEQTPATMSDQETDLAREVDRLRDEVQRLREEQRAREEAEQARPQPQPSVKRRRQPQFSSFVMVVAAKSKTMRLSAGRYGCSRSSEHGRCLYPISTWKPQRS